jgi:hypothetical protein
LTFRTFKKIFMSWHNPFKTIFRKQYTLSSKAEGKNQFFGYGFNLAQDRGKTVNAVLYVLFEGPETSFEASRPFMEVLGYTLYISVLV